MFTAGWICGCWTCGWGGTTVCVYREITRSQVLVSEIFFSHWKEQELFGEIADYFWLLLLKHQKFTVSFENVSTRKQKGTQWMMGTNKKDTEISLKQLPGARAEIIQATKQIMIAMDY